MTFLSTRGGHFAERNLGRGASIHSILPSLQSSSNRIAMVASSIELPWPPPSEWRQRRCIVVRLSSSIDFHFGSRSPFIACFVCVCVCVDSSSTTRMIYLLPNCYYRLSEVLSILPTFLLQSKPSPQTTRPHCSTETSRLSNVRE